MKVPDPKKRQAIRRIMEGVSTAETEAQRLGVSARQVRRWVEAVKTILPKPKPAAPMSDDPSGPEPSADVTPPVADAPEAENPALEAARRAGRVEGGLPAGPPTPGERVEAHADLAAECVKVVEEAKQLLVWAIVTFKYSPPLDMSQPDVLRCVELSPLAEAAIRSNAEYIYPILMKYTKDKLALFVFLGFDVFATARALHGLAIQKGWVKKAKARPAPAPDAPPPQEEPKP